MHRDSMSIGGEKLIETSPTWPRHVVPSAVLAISFCLTLTGCGAPPPVIDSTAEFVNALSAGHVRTEDRAALADDLARLDQVCWFIVISRTQSAVECSVSVHCKVHTGDVSGVSVYADGLTMTEAVASALKQIEERVPSAKLAMGRADMHRELPAIIDAIDEVNRTCWQLRLDKNNGWTITAKARKQSQIAGQTVLAQHSGLPQAMRDTVSQVRRLN